MMRGEPLTTQLKNSRYQVDKESFEPGKSVLEVLRDTPVLGSRWR